MKKLFVFLLGVVILVSMFGMNTLAVASSGTCGDIAVNDGKNVIWKLDSATGALTISGTGNMLDCIEVDAPWKQVADQIKSVIIEEGVTSVGVRCFQGMPALESVKMADGVASIGESAFESCLTLKNVSFGNGTCNSSAMTFQHCSALESITIPAGFRQLGLQMFYDCEALKDIYLEFDQTGCEKYPGQDWLNMGGTAGTPVVIHLVAKEVEGYTFKEWNITRDNTGVSGTTNPNTTIDTVDDQLITAVYEEIVVPATAAPTNAPTNAPEQSNATAKPVVEDKPSDNGNQLILFIILAIIILIAVVAVIVYKKVRKNAQEK